MCRFTNTKFKLAQNSLKIVVKRAKKYNLYIKRKYINDLFEWLKSPNRKPLIVYGARQVGKTYLLKELFANKFFSNKNAYIDCHNDIEFVKFCTNNYNLDAIINWIESHYNINLDSNTLLIFDESQDCPAVISLLKYFCQSRRDIPVIVTGSMVQIKLKRNIDNKSFLFPIGKIDELTIYPLNFEEFLINTNEKLLSNIKISYASKQKVNEGIHQAALSAFWEYISVGGMPEALNEYIYTKSLLNTKKILDNLYNNYLNDMLIYQESHILATKTLLVYNNLFSQLNKENKNFKYASLNPNLRNRDIANPIEWLNLSFITYQSFCLKERVTYPLMPNNFSLFRLYPSDIGLFVHMSKEPIESFLDTNRLNTLSGIFFETYVATELVNSGFKLYYWKGKSTNEIEFFIETNGKIVPIDVKKNKGKLTSINNYKMHNHLDYAVKVSTNNFNYNKENKILTIPFYMFFLICHDWKENKDVLLGW